MFQGVTYQFYQRPVGSLTFDEVVLISVLRYFECCSLLSLGRWLREKIIDEFIVDLSKRHPDGELLVVSTVQLYTGLVVLELGKTAT